MRSEVKKYFNLLIIATIIFSSISINVASQNELNIDIEKLDFRQEISIPIDTNRADAKFQPIDVCIKFDDFCWAINDTIHSVRIAYDDGLGLTELESQIYDLEFVDNNHIDSCSLVFLIPDEANGNEKYYVLYDESETSAPRYKDHLTVEDSHYYYEPVSGQKADLKYYKIIEDEYVTYAIAYEGDIFGNGVSQAIARMKPYATKMEVASMDQLANFGMLYSIDGEEEYCGTAMARNPSRSILIDGNLMVKLRIECFSPDGVVKTDNIYTYYYNPYETKRVCVNVNHEVIKTYEVGGSKILDGTYSSLLTFKSRSATIEKINVGSILPQLHLYTEDEIIKNYPMPPDPTSKVEEIVLSTIDDIDLGKKSWLCIDDLLTGKAHGLIFQSNSGFIQGDDDGLQVGAFLEQAIKLPGLEVDVGNVFATRNYYEKGDELNKIIPKGLVVSFNVEFITFEKGGYEAVDKESELYQSLINSRPKYLQKESDENDEDVEQFTLDTYVHLAPSIPFGSLLCAVIGKNLSYIYAELYKDNSFESSGSVSRISLCSADFDLQDKGFFQKIKTVVDMFDWRNFSFFKKISFPNLTPGKYVVKIYRENPIFANDHRYIGFATVGLASDNSVHIYCRPEGSIELSVLDQNKNGIENVKFLVMRNGVVVAEAISDKSGSVILKAPCYPVDPYVLKIFFDGFLVEEKEITLGLINNLIPLSDLFSIEQYKLTLNLEDTWGFAPAVDLNPTLTSETMVESINIYVDKSSNGKYFFTGIYPAEYTLKLGYKSYDLEKKVIIDADKTIDVIFPAEYQIDFDIWNSYGIPLADGVIWLHRNGETKKVAINDGNAIFSAPPGEYEITVLSDDYEIAKQKIDVRGDKKVDIVTSVDSLFHTIILYLGILLGIFSILFMLCKKKFFTGLKLLVIVLIVVSLVLPWWSVNGDDGLTSTTTNTLLIPSNIVTFTSSSQASGGEISVVPEEVTTALSVLTILLIISFLMIGFITIVKDRFRKITIMSSALSILFLIATITIFLYVMIQITQVSVGSFIGEGELEITIPGLAENKILQCSWGPNIGFYLVILAIICLITTFLHKKIIKYSQ